MEINTPWSNLKDGKGTVPGQRPYRPGLHIAALTVYPHNKALEKHPISKHIHVDR